MGTSADIAIVEATTATVPGLRNLDPIAGLIRATGPVSYDYQFGEGGGILGELVRKSWPVPDTLFAGAATLLAMAGDQLAGMALSFAGDEFYTRKQRLVEVATPMIVEQGLDAAQLVDLIRRAETASYLNAHIPSHAYYLLAIAVEPGFRGKSIGAALMDRVVEPARKGGFAQLQLDVLADNPAVDFYRARGFRTLVEIHSPELTETAGFPNEIRMGLDL